MVGAVLLVSASTEVEAPADAEAPRVVFFGLGLGVFSSFFLAFWFFLADVVATGSPLLVVETSCVAEVSCFLLAACLAPLPLGGGVSNNLSVGFFF